jgi:hypothetical protein
MSRKTGHDDRVNNGVSRRQFLTRTALTGAAAIGLPSVAALTVQGDPADSARAQERRSNVLYGFHQDLHFFGSSAPQRVDAVASIGAQVSRSTLQWLRNEPEEGVFNWSGSDIVYDSLLAAGIVPLWYVGRSPSWANGSSDGWVVPDFPSEAFDRWSDAMTNWSFLAAQRYPGCLWEVWNEPNEFHFWKPTPSVEAYSVLYRKVRDAILAGDPNARVAVGGITGLGAGCCINGIQFIRELVLNGDPIDHVGIHPYGRVGDPHECQAFQQSFRDTADVRVMLTELGNHAELWATEWGLLGSDPWGPLGGEMAQARYLWQGQSMFRSGKMEPCMDDSGAVDINVTVSTFFFDIDTANFPNLGVFTEQLEPKLAAKMFERFIRTVRPQED